MKVTFYFNNAHFSAKYITTMRGTKLLLIGEYTYSISGPLRDRGFRYKCSSCDSRRCKAFAHVSKDDYILKSFNLHNHPPAKYMPVSSGVYVKVSNF